MKRNFRAALITMFIFVLHTSLRADDVGEAEKAAPKRKKIEAGNLTLNVPESWKQNRKVTEPRVAEFAVPPVDGDKEAGEFAVFYFGKRGAGGVQANIERWVGQFDKEGREVRIATGESAAGESAKGKYTLVDLTGAYNKSVGPPIARKSKKMPGWRVINVVIETESGPYFLKLDGPEKTIAAVENDFRAAFGGKKETEEEQKQP